MTGQSTVGVGDDDRLKGWKEIGLYLHTCDRTVQRWERSLHMPVHRVERSRNAIVFAGRRELEIWLQSLEGRAALSERNGADSVYELGVPAGVDPASDGDALAAPPAEQPSAHALVQLAVSVQSGSESDAESAVKRPPELSTTAARRGPWRILVVLPVLAFVGAIAIFGATGYNYRTEVAPKPPTPIPNHRASDAPPSTTALPRSVRMRLAFSNGANVTMGIAYGGVATCIVPEGIAYAFTSERTTNGARIHASRFEQLNGHSTPQLSEVRAWSMQHGEAVTINELPGIVSIQLVTSPDKISAGPKVELPIR